MERIHFHKIQEKDKKRILEIYGASIEQDDATYVMICPSWEEWDEEHDKEYRIAAEVNGLIIGFVALSGKNSIEEKEKIGEISIYVDSEYRKKRIGTMLLHCLLMYMEYCNENTNKQYELLQARIFTNNIASIVLHEKVGFQKVSYCKDSLKKNGKWRDVYVYEHRIGII